MTSAAQLKEIPVAEIFGPTLQGEGALAGQRTMFVRTGFCDGAGDQWCTWCDSLFAVDPKYKDQWQLLTAKQIVDELVALALECQHVTLSGGNPLLHDLSELCRRLGQYEYSIHVETQGTVHRDWLALCSTVTVSPKPPSAGKCNVERFCEFVQKVRAQQRWSTPRLVCKVVVDPDRDDDYEFARDIMRIWTAMIGPRDRYLSTLTLPTDSAGDLLDRYRRLADRVVADPAFPDVACLPQLHVLLWSHARKV